MQQVKQRTKLNWLIFLVLTAYPLLIIGLAIDYGLTFGLGGFEIGLLLMGYYAANISVGVGLHRLWSHGSYKAHKLVELGLALLSAGTLQGPALAWASDHYRHHTFTDEEDDPHSPFFSFDSKSSFKGFFWSHMGWLLYSDTVKSLDKVTITKLGKNAILRWQMKYYWMIAVGMNGIVPPLFGYLIGHDFQSALAGYIFIGLGRALQQQMTFCVNSVCHFVGRRKYYAGTARDIWWLAFLLLGENWHNYHHAFPRDYRNGAKWYHFDVHKWIIFLMEKVGLAREVVRTPEVRVLAKMQETRRQVTKDVKTRLQLVEETANRLAQVAQIKLEGAQRSVEAMALKVKKRLLVLRTSAMALAASAKDLMAHSDTLHEKLVNEALNRLKKLEKLACELGITGVSQEHA